MLEKGYRDNEQLYLDFINNRIDLSNDYFSKETVYVKEAPDFPIYIAIKDEEKRKELFLEAFRVISESYLQLDRDIIMNETFWHSLLVTEKRNYILQKYPQVRNSLKDFKNIVLKKFDWENYIYKCIIATQYINDNVSAKEERQRYYELVIDNLDVFNYIIKYSIFRNDKFLLNILDIIDELGISELAKAKIKGREDLGDDERYGRRVIFELNKSYPVVMAPMLDKEELKKYFVTYLDYYYDVTQIIPEEELPLEVVEKNEQEKSDNKELIYANAVSDQETASTIVNGLDKFTKATGVAETRSSYNIEENNTEYEAKEELLVYLERHNLEYIDKRSKGGCIWVIGGRSIEQYLKPLEKDGIKFIFKPVGGRTTRRRAAWFWYER